MKPITYLTGNSLFKNDYQEIDENSILQQVMSELKNTMIKVDDDLTMIEENLCEHHATISHMLNQLPKANHHATKISPTKEQTDLKETLSDYQILKSTYPLSDNFRTISIKDIEVFHQQYLEHHQLLLDTANHLLAQLGLEVSSCQTRFQALSSSKK